jgi:hypothetical protein
VIINVSSFFFGLFDIVKSESIPFLLLLSELQILNKSSTFFGLVQILFIPDLSKKVCKFTVFKIKD